MKDLRMWFIFVFGAWTTALLIATIIKGHKRFITLTVLSMFFTCVLLFSDLTGQLFLKALGAEVNAKFQQIDSTQTIIKTDQRQLALAITDLIEIIELKDASHPDLISAEPTPESEKIKKECAQKIRKLKSELKEISK
jgi:hypothetical protein